jgi:hypothetical protein
MNKNGPPPPYDQPPMAPPSYSQCIGGVPPASPFTPAETCKLPLSSSMSVMYQYQCK